ncbi:hypothetical protein Cgig2_027291 [Carnegiea gigantea]|uniref:Uncharacterized protein n=1 Tax=Carnegiea gigantea TaxID=171969 RepID=A0A9Q1K209_9CARY|nr:hypothetical protein Cgig2_027291 [Carnegiea gigantea]
MNKVQGVLVEILTNCSKLGKFKDTAGPSQTQPTDANIGHQSTPSSQDDGLFASNPSFWDACVELAKTYEKTIHVESPNQGGSGGVGDAGSGSQSSLDSHIQRSLDLGSESSARDSVGDCFSPRKKMLAPHFRSSFFVRHIDALKSLTIREKQVSDWAFLRLDEVHYDSELLFTELLDGGAEFSGPKYKQFKHILDCENQMTSWVDFSNSKLGLGLGTKELGNSEYKTVSKGPVSTWQGIGLPFNNYA